MNAQPKLYVLDPFIYYALYSYLNNVPDPFEEAKKLVSNEEFKELLMLLNLLQKLPVKTVALSPNGLAGMLRG